MNYIIFDLEYNQKHPDNKNTKENSSLLFEIIQIGAIKFDKYFNKIGTFNTLIKPVVHTSIHPYVENLTKITDLDIQSSIKFPEVYQDFLNFIGDSPSCLVVWGLNDIKELLKNIKFHKLSLNRLPMEYIDLQHHASKYFNIPKGRKISLKNAVAELLIPTIGEFHDAFFDAYYTGEILKKIFSKDIQPLTYTESPQKQPAKSTEKVNTELLIKQIEKMFNKTLTPKEIKMVKTAYNMGRTRQFIKKD